MNSLPERAVLEEAAKVAKDYLDKLLSPGLDQAGGILADRVAFWRFKNRVSIILQAKAFLEAKGLSPKQVPMKAAYAILEAGSLEDDQEMQARWAAMLAHAANPDEPELLPALPKILSELSHVEVKAIEQLVVKYDYSFQVNDFLPFETADLLEFLGAYEGVFGIALLDNLRRLGLIESAGGASWIGMEEMKEPMLFTQLALELIRKSTFRDVGV